MYTGWKLCTSAGCSLLSTCLGGWLRSTSPRDSLPSRVSSPPRHLVTSPLSASHLPHVCLTSASHLPHNCLTSHLPSLVATWPHLPPLVTSPPHHHFAATSPPRRHLAASSLLAR